jgi:predicted N-formylglutamate amidohydrolase
MLTCKEMPMEDSSPSGPSPYLDGAAALLAPDEPAAVRIDRPESRSPFLMVCDHAGNRIPRALGTLGLAEAELQRHIAWDIGAGALAEIVAARLDACLIRQTYSRLVIDCNRPPGVPSSIATVSERTEIPGNRDLGETRKDARRRLIFEPYHGAIAAALDRRRALGIETVFLAMHSFTPVFMGEARSWECGVLYNRDGRFARILAALMASDDLSVGDNAPYAMTDASDYTVPVHAEARSLPYVELEIRQDLIADEAGRRVWAGRLLRLLPDAQRRLANATT